MMIVTDEGAIEQSTLDQMILQVLGEFDIPNVTLEGVRDWVVLDYEESDISQVTHRDIVEIIDASS